MNIGVSTAQSHASSLDSAPPSALARASSISATFLLPKT